ncbi:hypothetical protein [Embleya sp. NPDC020630]|uniref:hypothetical protein n=1 Tax=Embleya sp. NPDC020630 TaxID=3363979 RepID=UPI0037927B6E
MEDVGGERDVGVVGVVFRVLGFAGGGHAAASLVHRIGDWLAALDDGGRQSLYQ